MKTTSLLLSLACVAGCRVSRLGDQQIVRNAFAAQAAAARNNQTQPPAEMDAADAHAVMSRHREPLTPAQQQGAPAAQVLTTPQLGQTGATP